MRARRARWPARRTAPPRCAGRRRTAAPPSPSCRRSGSCRATPASVSSSAADRQRRPAAAAPRWPTTAVSTSTYSGSAASAGSAGSASARICRSLARATPRGCRSRRPPRRRRPRRRDAARRRRATTARAARRRTAPCPPDAVSTIASPAAGRATAAATGPAGSFFGTPGLALTTPPVARPLTGYSSSGTALPWPSSCITRSMSPVATPAATTRSPRSRFMPATPPAAALLTGRTLLASNRSVRPCAECSRISSPSPWATTATTRSPSGRSMAGDPPMCEPAKIGGLGPLDLAPLGDQQHVPARRRQRQQRDEVGAARERHGLRPARDARLDRHVGDAQAQHLAVAGVGVQLALGVGEDGGRHRVAGAHVERHAGDAAVERARRAGAAAGGEQHHVGARRGDDRDVGPARGGAGRRAGGARASRRRAACGAARRASRPSCAARRRRSRGARRSRRGCGRSRRRGGPSPRAPPAA